MTTDQLARMWAAEAGQEAYIRPSWHITLAHKHNCEALGIGFDPHANKVIFIFGLKDRDGELSLARARPHDWPTHKSWNAIVIVDEKDLSLPEKHKKLEDFFIGPKLIQQARDLIAEEGYAVPTKKNNVVHIPVQERGDQNSLQMAAAMFESAPAPSQH